MVNGATLQEKLAGEGRGRKKLSGTFNSTSLTRFADRQSDTKRIAGGMPPA